MTGMIRVQRGRNSSYSCATGCAARWRTRPSPSAATRQTPRSPMAAASCRLFVCRMHHSLCEVMLCGQPAADRSASVSCEHVRVCTSRGPPSYSRQGFVELQGGVWRECCFYGIRASCRCGSADKRWESQATRTRRTCAGTITVNIKPPSYCLASIAGAQGIRVPGEVWRGRHAGCALRGARAASRRRRLRPRHLPAGAAGHCAKGDLHRGRPADLP